jgi:hypothetical protein
MLGLVGVVEIDGSDNRLKVIAGIQTGYDTASMGSTPVSGNFGSSNLLDEFVDQLRASIKELFAGRINSQFASSHGKASK